jgi:hypothetical protein
MEKKLEIIRRMVQNGYHLMNRTAEELATIFTAEELEHMEQSFNERRMNK